MEQTAEASRLAALHGLAVLDTPPEDRFDRVVRLAQRLFDVPMVAVNLIDADRQWSKASVGVEPEIPRERSFCTRTIEQPGPLVVEDARLDERFRANPLVNGEGSIRFYAGHPLTAPGGQRVGALCIVDVKPRSLSDREVRLLTDLAGWVEKELALDQELVHAAEVQRQLLPRHAPDVPGFEVAGQCVTAREVGGDFFDWFPVDHQLQVVVADVMGKGIPAAIIAAGVRAMLRGASRFNDLDEALRRSAEGLDADLSETASFVTAFCARLDPRNGVLQYVDAGHGLSAVLGPDGSSYRQLASDGLPIGALPGDSWMAQVTMLAPGETVVSVSDGFLDHFGSPLEAAQAVIEANHASASAQEVVDRVVALCGRTGAAEDDITVVVVRRQAG